MQEAKTYTLTAGRGNIRSLIRALELEWMRCAREAKKIRRITRLQDKKGDLGDSSLTRNPNCYLTHTHTHSRTGGGIMGNHLWDRTRSSRREFEPTVSRRQTFTQGLIVSWTTSVNLVLRHQTKQQVGEGSASPWFKWEEFGTLSSVISISSLTVIRQWDWSFILSWCSSCPI